VKISPKLPVIIVVGMLALSVTVSVLAQGGFNLFGRPTTAANTLSGGDIQLAASVGQPDVGTLSGGDLTLTGGVTLEIGSGASGSSDDVKVYLPLVRRQ
jgi:hypothetical protein